MVVDRHASTLLDHTTVVVNLASSSLITLNVKVLTITQVGWLYKHNNTSVTHNV